MSLRDTQKTGFEKSTKQDIDLLNIWINENSDFRPYTEHDCVVVLNTQFHDSLCRASALWNLFLKLSGIAYRRMRTNTRICLVASVAQPVQNTFWGGYAGYFHAGYFFEDFLNKSQLCRTM